MFSTATVARDQTKPGSLLAQPRPQGLLLDDFQNGGSTGEDSGQR